MRHVGLLLALGLALTCAGSTAGDSQTPSSIRRVVTAVDQNGKAVVLFDGQVPLMTMRSPNPAGEIWVTERSPANLSSAADLAKTKVALPPPRGGTIFRIVEFVPMTPQIEKLDINTMMKVVGPEAPAKGLPPRHPMMHRTRSVDYALILSGEIDMLVDDGEVHLKAGDVVVQQATNHAWVNRGKEVCRIAFILMDSEEP
jgi:mannose-6-phosphate isomerase-like protein (cupin superfamily)